MWSLMTRYLDRTRSTFASRSGCWGAATAPERQPNCRVDGAVGSKPGRSTCGSTWSRRIDDGRGEPGRGGRAPNDALTLRATGVSIDEDGLWAYSPISRRRTNTTFASTPNSAASSCTRIRAIISPLVVTRPAASPGTCIVGKAGLPVQSVALCWRRRRRHNSVYRPGLHRVQPYDEYESIVIVRLADAHFPVTGEVSPFN